MGLKKRGGKKSIFNVFAVLFVFWLVLSGLFDYFHIALGVISCLLVAYLSSDLGHIDLGRVNRWQVLTRFAGYIPWLLYQVVLSNIHIAKIVLSPRIQLNPEVVVYPTFLKGDLSRTLFANSITLTPGTVTIDIDEENLYVHAINEKVKKDLLTGQMEKKVYNVFKGGDA